MSQKIAFSMQGISKIVPPQKTILRDIYLSFYYGAKIGVIGLNGSGKSTLLKIIAGIETHYNGSISRDPSLKIGLFTQEPQLNQDHTIQEAVEEGMKEITDLLEKFEKITMEFTDPDLSPEKMEKLLDQQTIIQEQIEHKNGWDIDRSLKVAMQALRLPPAHQKIRDLSGGEKRRVALCQLLLQKPDILLLDEPTNHLDAESVTWLELFLKSYPGTVIAVTHDRYFLDNIAGWILELDRGHGIPWEGNYTSWLDQKQKQLAAEQKQETKRQKALTNELEWIRMNPKARQAKSKARIAAYEKLLHQERQQIIEDLEIYIPPGPRLGAQVIEAISISKTLSNKTLLKDFSFKIPPASIVGIIGSNGVGKTTLFKMITQQLPVDSGSLKIGDSVKIAYVDQTKEALNPEHTVWEEISDGKNETILLGNKEVSSRAYCARFNFTGGDQMKKVQHLSGGERNRVHLAKVLKSGANVLLLDEPTNDLDINTLRALEEALLNFAGSALVISHDRWFLNRICSHLIVFEPQQMVFFEGNYQDYEIYKKSYGIPTA